MVKKYLVTGIKTVCGSLCCARATSVSAALNSASFGSCRSSSKEKKRVRKTLKTLDIQTQEIEEWKNKHWNKYDDIVIQCDRREYEIIKVIMNSILEEREKNGDNTSQKNALSSLFSLAEEGDDESDINEDNMDEDDRTPPDPKEDKKPTLSQEGNPITQNE